MKLLKIVINNAALFNKECEIDFINSDKVRKSISDNDDTLNAYKVKPGIYTQVLMAFTGLNATGKTTTLELISAISQILFQNKSLNDGLVKSVLIKAMPKYNKTFVKKQDLLQWCIYFLHDNKIYMLHSIIERIKTQESISFAYKDETLKSKLLSIATANNLFDFANDNKLYNIKTIQRETEQKNSQYLKNDLSIAIALGDHKEHIRPLGYETNFNIPQWTGRPSPEILQFFDPNIEKLNIGPAKSGSVLSELKFKNHGDIQYNGDIGMLNQLLSAGTIRGLNITPGIIGTLRDGGYVFIDELENHFNKKIIEWFMNLFTNSTTNPNGACLIFSTHYPEILDYFTRKDNIYITRRDKDNYCECIRYSNIIDRNELSKSKIVLENIIGGTAPRFNDLQNAKEWIKKEVSRRKS